MPHHHRCGAALAHGASYLLGAARPDIARGVDARDVRREILAGLDKVPLVEFNRVAQKAGVRIKSDEDERSRGGGSPLSRRSSYL